MKFYGVSCSATSKLEVAIPSDRNSRESLGMLIVQRRGLAKQTFQMEGGVTLKFSEPNTKESESEKRRQKTASLRQI